MSELWDKIRTERAAIVEALGTLTDEQWSTPSLCSNWTVRDLAGHILETIEMTPPRFFRNFAKAHFVFNDMTEAGVRRRGALLPAALVAEMTAGLSRTTSPPGPTMAMLGEAVIHGEDIRRPLGLARQVPEAAVRDVVEFYKGSNLIVGAKRRIAGLHLSATDTEWSCGGGPLVEGPLLSLLLAMTGRVSGIADCRGEGVATLSARG